MPAPYTAELLRPFPVPVDQLFAALTTPDRLNRWWGPQADCTVDLRPGGAYRWGMVIPNGVTIAAMGQFVEVQAPERLSFTWNWEGEAAFDTQVIFELRPTAAGSELLVTHTGFADSSMAENHLQGWNDCLARLAGLFAA